MSLNMHGMHIDYFKHEKSLACYLGDQGQLFYCIESYNIFETFQLGTSLE